MGERDSRMNETESQAGGIEKEMRVKFPSPGVSSGFCLSVPFCLRRNLSSCA